MDSECVHFLGGSEETDQTVVNGKNVKKVATRGGFRSSTSSASGAYTTWDTDKDEVEVNYEQMGGGKQSTCLSGVKGHVLKVLLLILIFLVGMLAGYMWNLRRLHRSPAPIQPATSSPTLAPEGAETTDAADKPVFGQLTDLIKTDSIKSFLRNFSQNVHMSGPKNNIVLQQTLTKHFRRCGLKTEEFHYSVLLSSPQYWENTNVVSIVDSNGTDLFTSWLPQDKSEKYHPELQVSNAFSASGNIVADVVYANYGEETDFEQLEKLNVSCFGRIVMMRYGRVYVGHKVARATSCGAAGVILYTDQNNVTGLNTTKSDMYPFTWWLPGNAARSGSVLENVEGDPLTPGLPSISSVNWTRVEDLSLPSVPVHSLGYREAQEILSNLDGASCPDDFQGRLPSGVQCRVGPGFTQTNVNSYSQVRLNIAYERNKWNITNVVGTFQGAVEPDRYIIVGCHYDAWNYGAVDPGSGMAVLAELAQVLGEMVKQGWQPRRTIMLVYWDAEEPGLMGSYEWVEDLYQVLWQRAVVYINLDGLVQGNHSLQVQASPLLHQLILNTSHDVETPAGHMTMYEQWMHQSNGVASINPVGAGSDQAAFVFLLGVPSLWPRHVYNGGKYPINVYPAYHTRFDRLDYVLNFTDPNLVTHERMCELVGQTVLRLATQAKLPFVVTELNDFLDRAFNELDSRAQQLKVATTQMDELHWVISKFSAGAVDFQDRFETLNSSDELAVQCYNDKLLLVTRAFIFPSQDSTRSSYRNVLFSPSGLKSSDGSLFGAIHNALTQWTKAADQDKKDEAYRDLLHELSVAIVSLRAANRALSEDLAV